MKTMKQGPSTHRKPNEGSRPRESRPMAVRLEEVVRTLEAISDDMSGRGLIDESDSISTVIADLRWQVEELRAGPGKWDVSDERRR